MPASNSGKPILELATEIIVTYLNNNQVEAKDVAPLIEEVHGALNKAAWDVEPEPEEKPIKVEVLPPERYGQKQPPVPIDKTVVAGGDYIVCLEDGKRYKSMKMTLERKFKLTPDEYRSKWGLPKDYPMTAPNYSARRKELSSAIMKRTQQQRRESRRD